MPRPHEPLTNDSIHSTVRAYLSRDPTEDWRPIGTWDVSQVTNMRNLFNIPNTIFNESLSDWDTSHVTDMSFMFCECTAFNQPVLLNTSRVTNMSGMFYGCATFNQPVVFDTSQVSNMGDMFCGCAAFNQPVEFDTSQVTDMSEMFIRCAAFNQPVLLNTSRVTNMYYMFSGCETFNQPVEFDTSRVTDMSRMFSRCTAFNQPVAFDTARVTNMIFMFYGCAVFNQPVLFDTSQVTNISSMFDGCTAFNQPVAFDTARVINPSFMFCKCDSLTHRPVFANHNPQVSMIYIPPTVQQSQTPQHVAPYLSLVLGPMHSKKTTQLVLNFDECVHHNISVTAVTHALDNRRGIDGIVLANGRRVPATHCASLLIFAQTDPSVQSSEVILVDEAQFFDDLVAGVTHLLSLRKRVYVYGLDSDFRRQKFGHILDLVPLCDTVTKMTARCTKCMGHAIFTQRISGDTSQVCVGSDMYEPRCRGCYV